MGKIHQRLYIWWGIFYQEVLAPFTDRTALLQLFAFPFFLYFLLSDKGCSAVIKEVSDQFTFVQAIIWSIPIYIIYCAVKAGFCVVQKEKELGEWVNDCFLFHTPKHIKTFFIKPDEDGEIVRQKLTGIPPHVLVYFKIEYEGGYGFLILKHHENDKIANLGAAPREVKQAVRLGKKSEIFIEKRIVDNSDPTVARLGLIYWEGKNVTRKIS